MAAEQQQQQQQRDEGGAQEGGAQLKGRPALPLDPRALQRGLLAGMDDFQRERAAQEAADSASRRTYEEVRLEEEQSKLDVQEAAQEVEFLKQGARSRLANHHLSTLLTPDRTERRVGTRTCVRPFHGKHRFVTQAPTRPSSAARPWAKAAPRARRRSKRR